MPKRILVVDDEPFMLRLYQYHLGKAGYDLINAQSGHDALKKASTLGPDLIIMDVMMTDIDGLSALKILKANADTSRIPVIMLTASAHNMTRQEAEASGADAFFTKPFSPTKLLAEIKRLAPEAAAGAPAPP